MAVSEAVREKVRNLPTQPGVYKKALYLQIVYL